jgi:predicted ribosome quality control (RQC) complex YloA/Tae2 family protein
LFWSKEEKKGAKRGEREERREEEEGERKKKKGKGKKKKRKIKKEMFISYNVILYYGFKDTKLNG